MRRLDPIWLVTALVCASLGSGGAALAQEVAAPSSAAPSSAAPVGNVDASLPDDAATDLWLLSSQATISRLDGTTGEVVGQFDVTTDDCYWEVLAGPADGAFWLMDSGDQGKRGNTNAGVEPIEVSRFCLGRFPLDGSEPQVFWIGLPDGTTFDIEDAVVLHDVLWMAAFVSPGGEVRPDQHLLFRLDLSAGVEQSGIEQGSKAVGAVGLLGDGLVIGQIPKKSKDMAWRPAAFTPDGGKPKALDIGLKKKEAFEGGIATGDGLVAFLDEKPVVYDPASGTVVRPRMPKYWDPEGTPTVLTKDAIWTAPDWTQIYAVPLIDGAAPVKATEPCNDMILSARGECPSIVGATPGAVWVADLPVVDESAAGPLRLRRFDTATGQPTVEVDATGLVDRASLRD